ncbi:DsbA family protein [Kribbella sp. NPDC059898]|uniref:DsbA family protein n=1 Tax=Kribbella sp. NPDC059898 TaxID=3346995 RepID=UPI0036490907
MSANARISIGIAAAFAVVVAVPLATSNRTADDTPVAAPDRVVRADSHRLGTAADGKVTFVEFLDFECEACGAAYPAVEKLRKDYAGKVTFVVRYFPIPSHLNAERAARAVEAAAAQGKFEAMYQKMYETQTEWAEQQVPADVRFRSYAEALGLELAAWDKAYNEPATLDRIRKDVVDGKELGVTGTPTFFLNGTKLEPKSVDDLTASIDAALE